MVRRAWSVVRVRAVTCIPFRLCRECPYMCVRLNCVLLYLYLHMPVSGGLCVKSEVGPLYVPDRKSVV